MMKPITQKQNVTDAAVYLDSVMIVPFWDGLISFAHDVVRQ